MVDILGIKRIIILVALVAVNAVLFLLAYNVLGPQFQKKERELQMTQGQVSKVRQDLNSIRVEFDLLDEQREDFKKLKAKQFFERQDRRRAEELLDTVQDRSRVIVAKVKLGGGITQDHPDAMQVDHKIVNSPMDIEVTALDDADIFRYIWLLENKFPGYVDVKELSLERNITVDRELLQSISAGEYPSVVIAKIKSRWKTMIPSSEVIETDGGRR